MTPARRPGLRWISLLGSVLIAACPPGRPADLVVLGKTWTGDTLRPWAEGVAARGDTIVAVGDSGMLTRWVGPTTRVLRAGSGLVVPGFTDGHLHFLAGGYQLSRFDLRYTASPAEFVARIKAFTAERKPGEWILGGDWDHERWPGSPLPRREWIDSVTPKNPVFIDRLDGHMALANSLALAAAGVTGGTPDVPGGVIVRDPGTGEPTGVFKDAAKGLITAVIPPTTPEQDDAALERAMRLVVSKGVVAVSAMSSPWNEVAAVKRAQARHALLLRFSLYPPASDWRRVADSVRADGPGDDWVRLAGVKAYMDGSLGSTTALFYDPYLDDPSTTGLQTTNLDSLRIWIGAADSAGLQVAVHAIGERANDLLLDVYDSVAAAHGARDRRFRVEHAQHLRPEAVTRFAQSGIIASMQPYHEMDDGRWAEKRIGPERIHNMYRFRSLLDQGVHLQFGSDWTVAPTDPVLGIYAAVTRRTLDGKNPGGWVPEQKISVEEALRAYTAGNAYGVFAEARRGRLVPGYLADLVVLDQDLFTIPPEGIDEVKVRTTVVGGRVVYQASP